MHTVKMITQMNRRRMAILGNEYPPRVLRPQQNGWVVAGERQFGNVTNAQDIEGSLTVQIMPEDRLPQRAAKMFVQHEAQRHRLTYRSFRRGRFLAGQSTPQGIEIEPRDSFLLLCDCGRAVSYVRVDFRLIVQIESRHHRRALASAPARLQEALPGAVSSNCFSGQKQLLKSRSHSGMVESCHSARVPWQSSYIEIATGGAQQLT